MGHLADLAGTLGKSLPGPEHDNFDVNKEDLVYKTRLNQNDYGSVYDSALVDALVRNPPEGVKRDMHTLGNAFANNLFSRLRGSAQRLEELQEQRQWHVELLQEHYRNNPSSWTSRSPLFKAFIEEDDPAKRAKALEALLRPPKQTGIDCMIVPMLIVEASQIWPPRDLNLNIPNPGEESVYKTLLGDTGEHGELLRAAKDEALDKAIEYFREHSYYARKESASI